MPTPEEEEQIRLARAALAQSGVPQGAMPQTRGQPSTEPALPDQGPLYTRGPEPGAVPEQRRPMSPEEAVVSTFLQESARPGGAPDRTAPVMDYALSRGRMLSPMSGVMGMFGLDDEGIAHLRRIAQQQGVPFDRVLTDAVLRMGAGNFPGAADRLAGLAQDARDRVGLDAAMQAGQVAEQPLVTGSGAGADPTADGAPTAPPGATISTMPGGPGRPGDPPVVAPDADKMRMVGMLARDDAEAGGAALADARKRTMDEAAVMQGEVDALEADFANREREAEEGVREAERKFASLNASIRAGTVNPDRWWTDRGVGSRIMTVFSLALGGLGGLFRGDGENRVLQMVKDEINQDLQIQEQDLGRAERADEAERRGAEQLLYHHFRMLGNVQSAKEAAVGTALRQYAAQLQALAQQSTDAQRQTALALQADQFLMEAEQADHRARTQLATIEAQRRRRPSAGGGVRHVITMPDGTRIPVSQREMVQLYAQGRLPGQPNAPGGAGAGTPVERNGVHQRFLAPRVSAVRTGLARVQEIRTLIRDAQSRGDDVPGIGTGLAIADRLGAERAVDLVLSDDAKKLRNSVRDLASQLARARSGAQQTDAERRAYFDLIAGSGSESEMLANLERVEQELRITGRALYDADPGQAGLAQADWLADFPSGEGSSLGGHGYVPIEAEVASAAERPEAEEER